MQRYAAKFSIVIPVLFMANAAQAYIGPGAGLSAIGSALALLGAVLLLIVGFVWYPVKRLMRRRKQAAPSSRSGSAREQDGKADERDESKAKRESDSSQSGPSS